MERLIKAIKIDVESKSVYEITIEDNLESFYNAIGCECFDVVDLGKNQCMFIDDEGLLHEEQKPFFSIGDLNICGNAIVMSVDPESGESEDVGVTVEDVADMVTFLEEGHREEPQIEVWTF